MDVSNLLSLTARTNLNSEPEIVENDEKVYLGCPGCDCCYEIEDNQTIPNSVSYAKLIALGNNYDKLVSKNLFDYQLHTSMELQPLESTISSVKIGELEDGENIFSITRLVKCDFYKNFPR